MNTWSVSQWASVGAAARISCFGREFNKTVSKTKKNDTLIIFGDSDT